jgi:hypothetical protein
MNLRFHKMLGSSWVTAPSGGLSSSAQLHRISFYSKQSLEITRITVNFKHIHRSSFTITCPSPLNANEMPVHFVGGNVIIPNKKRNNAYGLSLWRSWCQRLVMLAGGPETTCSSVNDLVKSTVTKYGEHIRGLFLFLSFLFFFHMAVTQFNLLFHRISAYV